MSLASQFGIIIGIIKSIYWILTRSSPKRKHILAKTSKLAAKMLQVYNELEIKPNFIFKKSILIPNIFCADIMNERYKHL